MSKKTFVEKILGAKAGSIVFKKPDIVLTHDNTASIKKTFEKMDGEKVFDPDQLLIVLDHNAPPTNAKLANQYQAIRKFVKDQNIENFYDVGNGICHQIMSYHARPGQIIVGSDSHTCTAGAFNAMAAGIDRTEAAGIWKKGDSWFRVPKTIKITLKGKLRSGVYAKDISLWIIGKIGSAGANYMSIEFHGDGVKNLSISERMTLTNLASEMGAKMAVFSLDEVLRDFYSGINIDGVWADEGANYQREIQVNLDEIYPLVAAPHHVDNIKAVAQVEGLAVHQGLIGTCTNGRLADLRIAADILKGKKITDDFQLLVIPASKEIFKQALKEGIILDLMDAGAVILSTSCGPCLGTGQGIPADNSRVISTANRNFLGRMGNKNAEIFLASPACVAYSALEGKIVNPLKGDQSKFPPKEQVETVSIKEGENRKYENVWNYQEVNNLNTDQMFAGNLTYNVLSSDGKVIMEHLFAGFDRNFAQNVKPDDIIIAGENFGCGSSREHPAVGLAYAGVRAVIVKSVNRIFFRSSVNQGLPIIVFPEVVDAYTNGDKIELDFNKGYLKVGEREFNFAPLPKDLMGIFNKGGLINWIKDK